MSKVQKKVTKQKSFAIPSAPDWEGVTLAAVAIEKAFQEVLAAREKARVEFTECADLARSWKEAGEPRNSQGMRDMRDKEMTAFREFEVLSAQAKAGKAQAQAAWTSAYCAREAAYALLGGK